LKRGLPYAISRTVHYAILVAGFLFAMSAIGLDMTKFTILAGAFGVGLGFGMQNIVNNFVSGLILLFERPVQTGDSVDVGGIGGEVSHIGIRATTLRTAEGADVIVPNATFISERVVNWTFSDRRRRVDIDVGVKYGTDPEKVIALLVATGRAHPEVLQIPEPIALLTRFGDNSLDFRLHVWTRFEIFVRVKSELTMAVNAALSGAGMEIPFPQRELHVKVDPGTPTYLLPGTTEGD
jgi:small-conductance mechanosensitive channel